MQSYTLGKEVNWQRYGELDKDERLLSHALTCAQKGEELDPEASYLAVSKQGQAFLLNLSAAIIFDWIITKNEVTELEAKLCDLFDASAEEIEQDVQETLQQFIQKGFIEG